MNRDLGTVAQRGLAAGAMATLVVMVVISILLLLPVEDSPRTWSTTDGGIEGLNSSSPAA